MNDTMTSLLTLVIMLIGLAMIVGGPQAVRGIFAPIAALIRKAVQLLFVALIVLLLASALLSGKKETRHQTTEDGPSVILDDSEQQAKELE